MPPAGFEPKISAREIYIYIYDISSLSVNELHQKELHGLPQSCDKKPHKGNSQHAKPQKLPPRTNALQQVF